MTLADLRPGMIFRARCGAWSATGRLVALTACAATVDLIDAAPTVRQFETAEGETVTIANSRRRFTWSRATEVERIDS
jgi:hypothetical protein